jgi:hypothetical protein
LVNTIATSLRSTRINACVRIITIRPAACLGNKHISVHIGSRPVTADCRSAVFAGCTGIEIVAGHAIGEWSRIANAIDASVLGARVVVIAICVDAAPAAAGIGRVSHIVTIIVQAVGAGNIPGRTFMSARVDVGIVIVAVCAALAVAVDIGVSV